MAYMTRHNSYIVKIQLCEKTKWAKNKSTNVAFGNERLTVNHWLEKDFFKPMEGIKWKHGIHGNIEDLLEKL